MTFSIILPVHNGGEYVKECAKSILSQTYRDFNFIVLDNCSTDGTTNWLESLNDPRIVIYRSDKLLPIEDNWARILNIPKNEFITLIGHDDLLDPNYLAEMHELILKHPKASLYQTHFRYIDSNGDFLQDCLPMDEIQYSHEFIACHMMKTLDSTGTGYVMRSDDYNKVGGISATYPNLIFADYVLWIKLIDLSYKATSWKSCFSYRKHQSVSRNTSAVKYQTAFGKYIEFLKLFMETNEKVENIVQHYGNDMLLYYCESLSHRLLKTPRHLRQLKVDEYISLCQKYAHDLSISEQFKPMQKWRISIASRLDKNSVGRSLFRIAKLFIR